jgi:formamidopyrimidine-DNA glycosylase
MPELPEAETVRRVLAERIVGKIITEVEVGKPTFYRAPDVRGFLGAKVESVGRRGKYILLKMVGGREFVFHLGMSGRLVIGEPGPHTRFRFAVEGCSVAFHDARRFGRVGCGLPKLGPEPLSDEFDAAHLANSLRKRKAPVKALIMDQRLIAGLGNIYASEALYRAGVRPGRAGGSLKRDEIARLVSTIKEVIALGVKLRGSTLEDTAYLDPLGRAGGFQDHMMVYGKDACPKGHPLKARVIGGRGSKFCLTCQR